MLLGKRVVFWALLGVVATLVAFNGFVAAIGPADEIQASAESNGIVNLVMEVDPPAARPGDIVTLSIRAHNRGLSTATPVLDVTYPANLSSQLRQIPNSTTFNFNQNSFRWQPVLSAGESRTFEMPLRVDSALMAEPIQRIEAVSANGEALAAELWSGTLPTIDILSVDEVAVGQPIQVRADIEGAGPFAQQWDLGDGRTFRADDPVISYAAVGEQTLTLNVENPLGTIFVRKTIVVNPEPIALYSLDDPSPSVDQPVTFVNQSGGAEPLSYRWEFDDGKTAFVREPLHRFTEVGLHTVRLIVENEFGVSETEMVIDVGESPEVGMELPAEAEVGQRVIARAIGDESVESYTWQMGIGREVEGEAISFVYTRPGLYTVTVSAENAYGVTTLAQPIVVAPGIIDNFLPAVFNQYDALYAAQMASSAEAAVPEFLQNFTPIDLSENIAPDDSTQEERLLWYINKARESVDLPPLAHVPVLSVAAKRHTNDMAFNRFWGHTGSDGSHPVERQEQAGYEGGYGGEATAWGFEFPSGAVQFWLDSPSHRPLILNPLVDQVGVAFTYDDTAPSIYYWTAEFGSTDRDYAVPSAPRSTPTPIPTAPIAVQPTQPPVIAAPTATPTPNIIVITPTPLPVEPTFIPTDAPTATPIIVIATPTALPTEPPTPTAESLEVEPAATATPTIAPTSAVEAATPTAQPTQTPQPQPTTVLNTPTPAVPPTTTPTPTVTPTPRPTDPPLVIATPTSTPEPAPTEESADTGRRGQAVEPSIVVDQFLQALIEDPSGIQALPYATYDVQADLLNGGSLGALQVEAELTAFAVRGVWTEGNERAASVELTLADGTVVFRTLRLASADQWRVASVELE